MSDLKDLLMREAEKKKAYDEQRVSLHHSTLRNLLKKEAEEQNAYAEERASLQRDWIEAVDRLMRQFECWLHEADPEGVLTIESTTHRISERRIGTYQVKGLQISLGSRSLGPCEIRIRPISRDTIGSVDGDPAGKNIKDGRVDMTNYEKKYILYRKLRPDGEEWVMVDDRDYRAQPVDREHFEAAIQSMLE